MANCVVSIVELGAASPDVWLKLDSYSFRSVKMLYGWNLGHMPKSYGFLVLNMKLEI